MCDVSNARKFYVLMHAAMNFQLLWWWWSSLSLPSSTWQLKTVPIADVYDTVLGFFRLFFYLTQSRVCWIVHTLLLVLCHINCLRNKFFSVISGGNEVGKRKNVFVFLIIHTMPCHASCRCCCCCCSSTDCINTEVCGVCVWFVLPFHVTLFFSTFKWMSLCVGSMAMVLKTLAESDEYVCVWLNSTKYGDIAWFR